MAVALLETKLYAPRRPRGLVPRPRLIERLDRGAQSTLTLISAPAGFGKTTLLAEWLATAPPGGRSAAWLSLDAGDNDPSTFWTYAITALQTVQPTVGRSAMALLQSPQPPPGEALLSVLLNEVAALSGAVVLVLDDYHLIEAGSIHDGMAFLLDHLPPNMHLVIASRADPVAPIARLRGRGELTEIRAADLRFSPDEAAAFLNGAMGLDLSAQHVADLESRTEGWIAALQLAALSMEGRDDVAGFITAFTGNDRYIVDYLVEEVLQRQPGPIRSFLLQTSILDRLCAPLCDAVTGSAGSKTMLETLERGNLFVVPLDDSRRWFRYHHLFADVLRAHLADEQPGEAPNLHAQASKWYAGNGQPAAAITHALAAHDLARAAGLVELESEAIVRGHQPARLVEWLEPIPDDLIRAMPVLSTYYAMALQGLGDMVGSAARLTDAERWMDGTAESDGMVVVDQAAFRSLPSRIALGRGFLAMASGDLAGTMELARRALGLLLEDEHHWRGAAAGLLELAHWASGDLAAAQPLHDDALASFERAGDIVFAIISAYHGADLLKGRGRLAEAGREYERWLQLAARHGDAATPSAANLHLGLSELHCEYGDLEGASHHLRLAEALGLLLPRMPYRHCLAGARLHQSQGDLDGAIALLDEAERLQIRGAVPDFRPVGAWRIRLRLAQGRLTEALDWVHAQGLTVDDDPDYRREYQHLTLARVLIAHAERERDAHALGDIDRLLGRLRVAAEAGGRMGAVIEILILQAIVQQAQDDIAAGLSHLQRALTLAEPEGYVRT
ncbi:MAG: helix-turn-helix transcriptional regulator, partial [Dehalococcoidia bacterium]